MFRKPLFWIVFCLVSFLSLLFTIRYLPEAMSMLQVDIVMSRSGSLQAADSLHAHLGIELEGYRQATSFRSDVQFQNYIELKGGGKEVFTKILQSDDYEPYYWYVRHFKEGETRELRAFFTAAGQVYGFEEKVPESEEGPALSREEASAIAGDAVRQQWFIDLDRYSLIESAQNELPNGRIDHTFTYEMNEDEITVDIGEADYRLIVTISGDRLTSLRHTTRVPESFRQEFSEMYSFNITLTMVAVGLMVLLYGTVMIIWLVTYIKEKRLCFKPALKWSLVVGFFSIISGLSYFSFYWIVYDTSTSANTYFFQQILNLLMGAVMSSALILVILMIAEAVTRDAFPQQVRFWSLMDKEVASSKTVLGYVVGSYLLIPVNLAFIAAFYLFTTTRLGWWIPSGVYENPNILGAFFPSVSAINIGLYAGIMEEALLRAIPLASLAVIGAKLNKRTLFLTIGIILQVFIFSAAHASYPQQPYYFRLVELIIPSLMFAYLYLRHNLVMAILVHFGFNASLGGLSFFTMQAEGLWLDRILFVILFFSPLLYVLFRRWQRDSWRSDKKISLFSSIYRFLLVNWDEVPQDKYNEADQAELTAADDVTEPEIDVKQDEHEPEKEETKPEKPHKYLTLFKALPFAVIFYLAGWFIFSEYERPRDIPQPRIEIQADQAVEIADEALREWLDSDIPEPFAPYPGIFQTPERVRYFVIGQSGKEAYSELKNNYLYEDALVVNYKRFTGTLEERSEQFSVFMTSGGEVFNIHHRIAEEIEGAELSEEAARELAMEALAALPDYKEMGLREVSLTPREQPNRMDWHFTYTDTLNLALEAGEPRIRVGITGDYISGISRFVFIPEDYERSIRSEHQTADTIEDISMVFLALFFLSGIVVGIIKTARKEIDVTAFKSVFLIMFILSILELLITWRFRTGRFFAIQPYSNQITMMIIGAAIQAVFMSGIYALFFSFTRFWQQNRTIEPLKKSEKPVLAVLGILLLAFIIPFTREAFYVGNILNIPQFNTVLSSNSTLYLLINRTKFLLLNFGMISYLFYIVEKMSQKSKLTRLPAMVVMVLFAFTIAINPRLPYYSEPYVSTALLSGIAYSLILYFAYKILTKLDGDYWIAGFLIFLSIDVFREMFMNRFVGAFSGYLISYIVVVVIFLFINSIARKKDIADR